MIDAAAETAIRRTKEEPCLFPASDPVAVIDGDLAAWRTLSEIAGREARSCREWRRLNGLGRELRGLRDCYVVARHPRIRAELLREAQAVSRRMRRSARRFRNDCGAS